MLPPLPRRLRLGLPFKVVCVTTFVGFIVSFSGWLYCTFFSPPGNQRIEKVGDFCGNVAAGLLICMFGEVLGAALTDPYEKPEGDDEEEKVESEPTWHEGAPDDDFRQSNLGAPR